MTFPQEHAACATNQTEADADSATRVAQRLDEQSFRRFAPLLAASQAYASYSGCRFRSSSFDGIGNPQAFPGAAPDIPTVSAQRSHDSGPRLAAKLRAAPLVREFAHRLRSGIDPGLNEEIERAFRIVMRESVRNAMMGMFQAYDMFPPSPPPAGIQDDDCSYEDVTAPLPAIAQRLYNDQVRRVSDPGMGALEIKAMTAAYLVDFADGVGMKMPPTPETQQAMFKEIAERMAEFSRQSRNPNGSNARDVFLRGLGVGSAAEKLRSDAKKWWDENWKATLWTTGCAIALGAATVAGAMRSKRLDS